MWLLSYFDPPWTTALIVQVEKSTKKNDSKSKRRESPELPKKKVVSKKKDRVAASRFISAEPAGQWLKVRKVWNDETDAMTLAVFI